MKIHKMPYERECKHGTDLTESDCMNCENDAEELNTCAEAATADTVGVLRDRSGFDDLFGNLDRETQDEIMDEICGAIKGWMKQYAKAVEW